MQPNGLISIGEVARRSGVAASALRFYEEEGLIHSTRLPGQQRQFSRDVLRRVAFIRVAQGVGLSLQEIAAALATLPAQRTPTPADWNELAQGWRGRLQERIDTLTALRDQLGACIGCGCLSLQSCALYNPGDIAASKGNGPRYLLGDRPGIAPPGKGR
ncbi:MULTISPECIES: redox-sensitive transcriptional activator SoxR [Silvimonas]|uniref:redox-sensitive transcriptional activator SoxR n=1 Tax=Silvimonas TaxID=300264 RepID=UPI0024B33C17|nr:MULTISPECIES: redox-sensitive transcriptional activator SoxR [Silvimonas]MDR3429652.1 redox-sensitive transcriptional activator SoxR [Silvimonas sp.]